MHPVTLTSPSSSPPHSQRMDTKTPVLRRTLNLNMIDSTSNNSNHTPRRSLRPVSCFILDSELSTPPKSGNDLSDASPGESIRQRAARLKQSGEEGWKRRIRKEDIPVVMRSESVPLEDTEKVPSPSIVINMKDSAPQHPPPSTDSVQLRPKAGNANVGSRPNYRSGSVIQNRLSSLFESANGWKERVPLADA